jgi:hypothetical protein
VRLYPAEFLPHNNAGMSPVKSRKKRKHKIHYHKWKNVQRKRKHNHGEEYISAAGKE